VVTTHFEKNLKMGYFEYVDYLNDLHGIAEYDYFANEKCASKNKKVSRSDEGLVCHHVFEYYAPQLSHPEQIPKSREFSLLRFTRALIASCKNYIRKLFQ